MAGQIIDVPGQGEIEFPADMPDDQIAAAIKRIQLSPMQKRMGLGKQATRWAISTVRATTRLRGRRQGDGPDRLAGWKVRLRTSLLWRRIR
jgi:hypothetical protein